MYYRIVPCTYCTNWIFKAKLFNICCIMNEQHILLIAFLYCVSISQCQHLVKIWIKPNAWARISKGFIFNPQRACAVRVTVVGSVCLSVCPSLRLSIKSHLTSRAFVPAENAVTYSVDNEGKNIRGVFSETAPLRRFNTSCIVQLSVRSAVFTLRMRHYSTMHRALRIVCCSCS